MKSPLFENEFSDNTVMIYRYKTAEVANIIFYFEVKGDTFL